MSSVLEMSNKIDYKEGDLVEVALAGDTNNIIDAEICGIAIVNIVDFWIVRPVRPIENYSYSCINVQHTFIRPKGDNRPFLCEGVNRTY